MRLQLTLILFLILYSLRALSVGCPSLSEAQIILNLSLKYPLVVKSVVPFPSFNSCKISTESGETFFLSRDKKFLIEGTIINIPKVKFPKEDLSLFKRKALFSLGKGEDIFVFTNPFCKVCRKNKKLLVNLLEKYRVNVIPLGFKGDEFKAAVSSYCLDLNEKNFFSLHRIKLCDEGKLKVWSISDKFKKIGITGTPIVVTSDGSIFIGVDGIRELLRKN
jgi:thiol-disulfide isomerase/thioredoxin